MTAQGAIVLTITGILAFANGANDVSKGVATLVGSGVTDYRKAIAWGAAFTAVGGLLSAFLAGAMLATFGKGLVAPGVTPTFAAALATLVGAAGWVAIATRTGLPVSTTHALVGALTGVAAAAYGLGAVEWSVLGAKVFIPLLASPLAAFLLTWIALRLPVKGAAVGSEARGTLDHLHWLSSGATSLARGMNDAPKIVALALAAAALGPSARLSAPPVFASVVAGMVLGSLVAGRRVSRVLAEEVTTMNHREGFAANLVTAALVTAGAVQGLPMSTTHVSSGGIVGAGARRRDLRQRTLRGIALAWLVTLPAAAALGVAAYGLARAFQG